MRISNEIMHNHYITAPSVLNKGEQMKNTDWKSVKERADEYDKSNTWEHLDRYDNSHECESDEEINERIRKEKRRTKKYKLYLT